MYSVVYRERQKKKKKYTAARVFIFNGFVILIEQTIVFTLTGKSNCYDTTGHSFSILLFFFI